MKKVQCFGSPPQIVFMGWREGPLGSGNQPMLDSFRPVLDKSARACCLWQPAHAAMSFAGVPVEGNG